MKACLAARDLPRQPGMAALAMLLAWLSSPATAAEPRVFFAPAARPAITASRAALLAGETPANTSTMTAGESTPGNTSANGPAAGAVTRAVPRLEGISRTSGGKSHAWIDGHRYEDGELYRGQRIRVQRNGVLLLAPSGAARLLLVGERVAQDAPRPVEPSS